MFDQSKQKHVWFPEYFDKPITGKAIIRPRGSLYQEYLNKGGQP